ncbi:unnamed protein product [Cercospora beticola]|nr:unnamed protein product [Cercospora beticola]
MALYLRNRGTVQANAHGELPGWRPLEHVEAHQLSSIQWWLTRIKTAINQLQVTKIRKCTPRIQWTAEQLDPRKFFDMVLEDLLTNASPQPGRNFVKQDAKVTNRKKCMKFLVNIV